jgi:hypothetical protein
MHRRLSHAALPLIATAFLCGCEHAENYRWNAESHPDFTPTLTPPTTTQSDFRGWVYPSVSVYSFATPAPTAGDAGLRDLSDRGQAALIEAMTKAGAKPDDIRDMLSKPLKARSAPAEGVATVEGAYKRTLVANVTKGWSAAPGDRLVWTWVDIRPLNFVFDGYSVIATDNQVLNIEQVTNATTASLTGSLGKTGSDTSTTNTAGSPVSSILSNVASTTAGVSGSLSNVYTTTASINQQYVKLGADIVPSELRIYRESERNLDVAGNTLIALTMRIDPTKWHDLSPDQTQRVAKLDLVTDDGKFRTPDDVTFEVGLNKAPPRCPLLARVVLYYQIRRTKDGRSYVEGQQDARYTQRQFDAGEVTIVSADDVSKPSWRIYPRTMSTQALKVMDIFGAPGWLDFTSYEQARNFAEWLNHNSAAYVGKMSAPIGKAGLVLTTGINDQALFAGPYFAERYVDPNVEAKCVKMNTVLPAAALLSVPPAGVIPESRP